VLLCRCDVDTHARLKVSSSWLKSNTVPKYAALRRSMIRYEEDVSPDSTSSEEADDIDALMDASSSSAPVPGARARPPPAPAALARPSSPFAESCSLPVRRCLCFSSL